MSASLTQAGDATLDVSNLVARPVSRGMRSRRPPLSSRLSSRRGAPSGNNSARVRTPRLPPPPVPRIAEGSLQELVAASSRPAASFRSGAGGGGGGGAGASARSSIRSMRSYRSGAGAALVASGRAGAAAATVKTGLGGEAGRVRTPLQYAATAGGNQSLFMPLEAAEKLLHDKLSMAGDEARVIFRSFDSDKSGSISTAELRAVLEDRFHIHLSDGDFDTLVGKFLADDGDTEISLAEFLAAFGSTILGHGDEGGLSSMMHARPDTPEEYVKRVHAKQAAFAAAQHSLPWQAADKALRLKLVDQFSQVRKAFRRIDTDGSQTVGPAELRQLMENFNILVDDEQFALLWAAHDADDSGSMTFSEFVESFASDIAGDGSAPDASRPGHQTGAASENDAVDALVSQRVRRSWRALELACRTRDVGGSGELTRQDFREALQAACGVELHPYHLGRLCERIDADGEAGGRVSYGNFIRSEVGDLLAPAATAPAVRAVSRGASARVTTPRLDAKRLHMMQRTGQLATAAPQPLSQPLCRAVAHSWRKMRKALKQIDMEYGAGSAATARSVSRWRGRVPIRDFEQTMKKHSAALTERDRVQLIARLSDHRGDVAYNDFFRLALRNAPRSAR